ncbi:MAG: family 43 glycosylhydrolase [Rikenellaceae bacterium]
MKKLLTTLFVALATIFSVNAGNPILKFADPNFLYLADPAAEVYNGRLYLYCSHDQANAADYSQMQDYAIVSTDDMVNWTNHGVVIKPREYSWADGQMNAPDAAYKNGWYYLYFPYDKTHIGVAKSRTPVGPWEEAVTDKITSIFDPTVFVDDDGQAYIYGNDHKIRFNKDEKGSFIYGAKLKDNMIELDGEWQRLSKEPVAEAVHIFKRDGKYHFTARVGKSTTHWVSDSPLPSEYAECRGVITPVQRDAPAHNSFVEFNGKWYIFYQRGDVNKGTFHRRSACFEEIQFDDNHNIRPITYTLGEDVELVNPLVTPW